MHFSKYFILNKMEVCDKYLKLVFKYIYDMVLFQHDRSEEESGCQTTDCNLTTLQLEISNTQFRLKFRMKYLYSYDCWTLHMNMIMDDPVCRVPSQCGEDIEPGAWIYWFQTLMISLINNLSIYYKRPIQR